MVGRSLQNGRVQLTLMHMATFRVSVYVNRRDKSLKLVLDSSLNTILKETFSKQLIGNTYHLFVHPETEH